MAVGKGSMARASRSAAKKAAPEAEAVKAVIEETAEALLSSPAALAEPEKDTPVKKTSAKKTASKKSASEKTPVKKEASEKAPAKKVASKKAGGTKKAVKSEEAPAAAETVPADAPDTAPVKPVKHPWDNCVQFGQDLPVFYL